MLTAQEEYETSRQELGAESCRDEDADDDPESPKIPEDYQKEQVTLNISSD
jgi:hypothetical protein